ncbi:alpha-N-acetyl-neuraminyl-2,3-beta-galactosyl-1,3-N-acetyl-galactosaminide alpha-2,6-sialyltransferase-like [Saccoglossus kowalevskii]|uniref:Alpha-N-acetylgalactosaminide alpha-2,6-sialyltransferase 5-like n=1 Tax=Saccoglossus kowalevskii TaxID=10224 RepID=A0ABM0MXZ1_SACKO|nr:PREDICTED: alpha-N-acetylgalactosaminide alpha-2,6-sialyltransferase 5-like [Saccoglossus kowalevskii]
MARNRRIILVVSAVIFICVIYYASNDKLHRETSDETHKLVYLDVEGRTLPCISRGRLTTNSDSEAQDQFLCGERWSDLQEAITKMETKRLSAEDVGKYHMMKVAANKDVLLKKRVIDMFSKDPIGYVRMRNESEVLDLHCDVCALVSSSGQILGSGAGAEIDNNTCVIRMNTSPTRGYEQDVGTKTTLRLASFDMVLYRMFERQGLMQDGGMSETLVLWISNHKTVRSLVRGETMRLRRQYPTLDPYITTVKQIDYSDLVWKLETGKERKSSGTWLSTGWYTMLLALKICDRLNMYGFIESDHCYKIQPSSSKDTLQHYYEVNGPKECDFSRSQEHGQRYTHRFFTEKYVFKKWARVYNTTFHHPSWDLHRKDKRTPFMAQNHGKKKPI